MVSPISAVVFKISFQACMEAVTLSDGHKPLGKSASRLACDAESPRPSHSKQGRRASTPEQVQLHWCASRPPKRYCARHASTHGEHAEREEVLPEIFAEQRGIHSRPYQEAVDLDRVVADSTCTIFAASAARTPQMRAESLGRK